MKALTKTTTGNCTRRAKKVEKWRRTINKTFLSLCGGYVPPPLLNSFRRNCFGLLKRQLPTLQISGEKSKLGVRRVSSLTLPAFSYRRLAALRSRLCSWPIATYQSRVFTLKDYLQLQSASARQVTVETGYRPFQSLLLA